VVTVVFLLLLGAKRLPDSARCLGESLHVFRKTLHEPPGAVGPEPRA
jgi:Sec-independent protein translocase protein TatA